MKSEHGRTVITVMVWGPPQSGKATFMHAVAKLFTAPVVSEDRHSERVLRVDVTTPELDRVVGRPSLWRLVAVPGATYYSGGRRNHVLDADALLFIADSRKEALDENIAALNDLFSDLHQVRSTTAVPAAMYFTKQDVAGVFPPQQLQPLLNAHSWPAVAGNARAGAGVTEVLTALAGAVAAALASVAALATATPAHQSWLLSCWRCASMLEVAPKPVPGAVFTCASCRSPLEVVNVDRGTTQAPAQRASTPTRASPTTAPRDDSASGGYALQSAPATTPSAGQAALAPLQRPRPATDPSGALAIITQQGNQADAASGLTLPEGWVAIAALEVSPLGRRLRVRETATGRTWRAFVLSEAVLAEPGYALELEAHVRRIAYVKHARLVALHQCIPTATSAVFIADDAPDREPLSHVLARRRILAPPHAVAVAMQVLEALQQAAAAYVVHGWIRPDAVWLNADGDAQLDECYIPKPYRLLRAELSGSSASTEYFLTPEMTRDPVVVDVRTDVFLVGALLFRMISGQGLITGYTANEALHQFAQAGPMPLRNLVPNVSRELEQVIKRMVAVDPKDRYPSIEAAVDALRRFGGGAHRQTLSLTRPVVREPTPVRGNPAAATLPQRASRGARATTAGASDQRSSRIPAAVPSAAPRAGGLGAPAALPPAPVPLTAHSGARHSNHGRSIAAKESERASITRTAPSARGETGCMLVIIVGLIVVIAGLCAYLLDWPKPWAEYMHPPAAATPSPAMAPHNPVTPASQPTVRAASASGIPAPSPAMPATPHTVQSAPPGPAVMSIAVPSASAASQPVSP